jgi:hypothetical protein
MQNYGVAINESKERKFRKSRDCFLLISSVTTASRWRHRQACDEDRPEDGRLQQRASGLVTLKASFRGFRMRDIRVYRSFHIPRSSLHSRRNARIFFRSARVCLE